MTDYTLEPAKSNRSCCRICNKRIAKDELRLGVITYEPHETTRWFHVHHIVDQDRRINVLHRPALREYLINHMSLLPKEVQKFLQELEVPKPTVNPHPIGSANLGMNVVAGGLTQMYTNFRTFTFGLPKDLMYSNLWNWRCLLATMLVCNTSEDSMLAFLPTLFLRFPNPEAMEKKLDDLEEMITIMNQFKVRHARRKIGHLQKTNSIILHKYGGLVPDERKDLIQLPGVGRHVSSVVLAWVHQKGEFGVDVHVRRIMARLGLISENAPEIEIEESVKNLIPADQVGHFSRAFVDHGQTTCSFSPDCSSCIFKHACPSSTLDW